MLLEGCPFGIIIGFVDLIQLYQALSSRFVHGWALRVYLGGICGATWVCAFCLLFRWVCRLLGVGIGWRLWLVFGCTWDILRSD